MITNSGEFINMTKKYILVGTMLVLLGTSGCSYIPTENISYGVYYNDTDLSNTPKNELQARLQELNSKIPQTISIDMGNNKKQQATYHDLGIQIDTDAMVKAISTYGYEDDMWTLLSNRFNALFYGHHFKPQYKLDEVKGKTYLSELAKQLIHQDMMHTLPLKMDKLYYILQKRVSVSILMLPLRN